MKFLNNEQFSALKSASDNYNAIIAAAKEADENITDESSSEELLSVIQAGSNQDSMIADLNATIRTLTEENTQLKSAPESKIEELNGLKGTPATPATGLNAKEEPTSTTGEEDDIESISNAHKGDPVALIAAMEAAGLI